MAANAGRSLTAAGRPLTAGKLRYGRCWCNKEAVRSLSHVGEDHRAYHQGVGCPYRKNTIYIRSQVRTNQSSL